MSLRTTWVCTILAPITKKIIKIFGTNWKATELELFQQGFQLKLFPSHSNSIEIAQTTSVDIC